jgi:acyl-CoA thioester hydrolase
VPFVHRLRVRFAETDAMGVVHHGAYPLYLEAARVELLRAAGHPYVDIRADGVDFAVVDLAIGYEKPLYFDDEVVVAVQLAEVSRASFTLAYELGTDRGRCASARTRHAAVGPDGRPRRLPGWIGSLAPTPADEATPADPPPR